MQGAGPGASVGLVVLDVTRGRGPAQDQEEMQMIVICSSPGGRWLQQQRRRRWRQRRCRPSAGCCRCRSRLGWWTWRRRCWRRRTWRCGAGGAAGGCCSLLHLCYEKQEEACGQPSKVNMQHGKKKKQALFCFLNTSMIQGLELSIRYTKCVVCSSQWFYQMAPVARSDHRIYI